MIRIIATRKDGKLVLYKSKNYTADFVALMNRKLRSGEIVEYEIE